MIIHQELKDKLYKNSCHIPVRCSISECNDEASFFLCNGNHEDDVHLCDNHGNMLINEDGYYNHINTTEMTIEEIETGIYMCNEDCRICNS